MGDRYHCTDSFVPRDMDVSRCWQTGEVALVMGIMGVDSDTYTHIDLPFLRSVT